MGGYYFFATVWAPRLLTTFKARHWLTTVAAAVVTPTAEVWPEIFLMFVQFGGLTLVVWSVGVAAPAPAALRAVDSPYRGVPLFIAPGAAPLGGWLSFRSLGVAPGAARLTRAVSLVLEGGSTPGAVGGRTWPPLRRGLQARLSASRLGAARV